MNCVVLYNSIKRWYVCVVFLMSDSQVQTIIADFNRDHKLALGDFLHFYGNVPITTKITNVRMTDVDLHSMNLRFKHKDVEFDIDKVILFDPPLKGLNDFDIRITAMIKDAAHGRGYSHIQIKEVIYPNKPHEILVIMAVILPFFCYTYRPLLYWLPLPSMIKNFLDDDQVLVSVMLLALAIHILESWMMLRPKLTYYRVPTELLIEWYFLGLLEGFAPTQRIDDLAEKLEKKY